MFEKWFKSRLFCWVVLMVGLSGLPAWAGDLKVANVFHDHMVVQRDKALLVSGTAPAGKVVSVMMRDQVRSTIADNDGNWSTQLDPQSSKVPSTMQVLCEDEIIKINDVLFGDVFVFAGQSNISMPCRSTDDCQNSIFKNLDRVRVYNPIDAPQYWLCPSPDDVKKLSAVAMSYAAYLTRVVPEDVPIGIIQCGVSASPIQAWIPEEDMPEKGRFESSVWPIGSVYSKYLTDVFRLPCKAIIWYQGECDLERFRVYTSLFTSFSRSWRKRCGLTVPFIVVQLPGYGKKNKDTAMGYYAAFREAQLKCAKLPSCFVVPTIDIDPGAASIGLHPAHKKELGERLARLVGSLFFNIPGGLMPRVDEIEFSPKDITVHYRNVLGGLKLAAADVSGFEIAGEDGLYWKADAVVNGDDLNLSNQKCENPRYIRYAWNDRPAAVLVTGNGLPVSPFRTDHLPLVTAPLQNTAFLQ